MTVAACSLFLSSALSSLSLRASSTKDERDFLVSPRPLKSTTLERLDDPPKKDISESLEQINTNQLISMQRKPSSCGDEADRSGYFKWNREKASSSVGKQGGEKSIPARIHKTPSTRSKQKLKP